VITKAYDAILIKNLEADVGVPPLEIYLDSLQVRF
jgi:hypothetical protein